MAIKTWTGADTSAPTAFNEPNNWSDGAVPGSGDTLVFSAQYDFSCTSSLDAGTTAFTKIIVEEGFSGDIGTSSASLISDVGLIEYHGKGIAYFKVGSGGINTIITNSGGDSSGNYGVHIDGTISTLTVSGGNVAVCNESADSGAVTNVRVSGGYVCLGAQLTSVSNVNITGGKVLTRKSAATVKIYGGNFETAEDAAISTKLTSYGGTCTMNGTGTVAEIEANGDASTVIDFTKQGVARTVTTLKQNGGTIIYDPDVITITTDSDPDKAIQRSVAPVNTGSY
tara:strand:+ start:1689 stop:2537 length:849 start_codon:yes stop_codon:yes gene_type:complete